MLEKTPQEILPQSGTTIKRYVFTDLQIEVAKLRAQGLSYSKIAEKLQEKFGKPFEPPHLVRAYKDFYESGTAEKIRQAFKELQSARFWEKHRDYTRPTLLGHQVQKQMLLDGFWYMPLNKVPFGYAVDETRRLQFDPKMESLLKQAINRVLEGEAPLKVARDLGIKADNLYRFLKSPFIKGYCTYNGEILPGKHPKYVDEHTWEKLQQVLSVKRPSRPKFGFKRTASGVAIDEGKIPIMRQICKLRLEKKGIEQIMKELKISKTNVCRVLKDPDYKDAVGADLWEAAHKVYIEYGPSAGREYMKKRMIQAEAAILLYLKEHGPASTSQIASATKISESAVFSHLKFLKANNIVDRESKRKGKWFLKTK